MNPWKVSLASDSQVSFLFRKIVYKCGFSGQPVLITNRKH